MEIIKVHRLFFFLSLVLTVKAQGLVSQDICQICKCKNETGDIMADCRDSNLNELQIESANYGDTQILILSHLNLNRVPVIRAPQLSNLDLSNNQISDLSESGPDVGPLLENRPGSITNGAFENLSLQVLNLSYNRLSNLTGEMLNGLRDLLTLDVSHNDIKTIDADAFEGFPMLKELRLNHNELTKVPSAISSMSINSLRETLRYLSLSANSIQVLPQDSFRRLVYLQTLDLSRNELEFVHPEAFQKMIFPNLKTLYLNTNRLQTLSVRTIQALESLTTLSLYMNPWVCNCTLTKLARYLEIQRNDINVIKFNSTDCTTDDASKFSFTSREIDAFCEAFPIHIVLPAAFGAVVFIIATVIIAICCYKKRRRFPVQQISAGHTNESTINTETSIQQSYFQISTVSTDDNLSSLEASTRSEHFYSSIKSQNVQPVPLIYAYADAPRRPDVSQHSADSEYKNTVQPKNEGGPQLPKSKDDYLVPNLPAR